jgi:hypothetical protein
MQQQDWQGQTGNRRWGHCAIAARVTTQHPSDGVIWASWGGSQGAIVSNTIRFRLPVQLPWPTARVNNLPIPATRNTTLALSRNPVAQSRRGSRLPRSRSPCWPAYVSQLRFARGWSTPPISPCIALPDVTLAPRLVGLKSGPHRCIADGSGQFCRRRAV